MQRIVGNGVIWPQEIDRNVVMAWGNVDSQQHNHNATRAYMALHEVKLSGDIMGLRQ